MIFPQTQFFIMDAMWPTFRPRWYVSYLVSLAQNNQDRDFRKTLTNHNKKTSLVLNPNIKHENQGHEHEMCKT
jgi:hypothetical protein